jgi:hypothetical protein
MSQHADSVVPGRHRRLVAALAGLVLAVPLAVVATAAQAVTPQAVGLRFDAVADHASGFPAPVKGQPFDVTVTALDVNGLPVAVNKATPISLSVLVGTGTLSGTTTGSIPKNSSTGTISGAIYSAFGNSQQFAVTSPQLTGTQFTVDVQAVLGFKDLKPGKAGSVDSCVGMTAAQPTCATLVLPNGANGRAVLTEQSCRDSFTCRADNGVTSLLVNGVADLGTLYSRTNPATLIVGCDKSVCGNGGVSSFQLLAQLKLDLAPGLAPACPSKGQIDPSGPAYCVDYVQSKRDNAGDTWLYLLFADDVRGSLP